MGQDLSDTEATRPDANNQADVVKAALPIDQGSTGQRAPDEICEPRFGSKLIHKL
jgi:hypothetical protein